MSRKLLPAECVIKMNIWYRKNNTCYENTVNDVGEWQKKTCLHSLVTNSLFGFVCSILCKTVSKIVQNEWVIGVRSSTSNGLLTNFKFHR